MYVLRSNNLLNLLFEQRETVEIVAMIKLLIITMWVLNNSDFEGNRNNNEII